MIMTKYILYYETTHVYQKWHNTNVIIWIVFRCLLSKDLLLVATMDFEGRIFKL